MNKLFGLMAMLVMLAVSGCGSVNSAVESEKVVNEDVVATVTEVTDDDNDTDTEEGDIVETVVETNLDEIDLEADKKDAIDETEHIGSIESAREFALNGEYQNAIDEYGNVSESEYNVNDYHNYAFCIANSNAYEDIEKAFELYEKAYSMGDEDAISNAFAAWIYYGSDKNIDYLRKLIKLSVETSDAKVIDYCAAIADDDGMKTLKELQGMSDVELTKYFSENTNYFENQGEVKETSTPTSTRTEKYEYVGTYNWDDDENKDAGTVYIYTKYVGSYPNIELLDEKLKE